ncbi:MAG TPA: dienelactone hydrolase family protein [Stellaceae bacterium]|nr:dienelactone hydrolase family protein [Stellaceae bacterium]
MTEYLFDLATEDGQMPVFLSHPEKGGPFPAVILYMDMFGAREALYEVARYVAAVGYCCAVPDLYYRQGRVLYDFRDERNRVLSTHRLGPGVRDAMISESRKLTDEMVLADTGALLGYLSDGARARSDEVGVFGYCMGGRYAILAAARYPERIAAAGCLHGTNLVTDKPDSPHRMVGRMRGELYCGFGADDPYAKPETIEAFHAALSQAPVRYEYAIHPGAGHGYALPDRDIYGPQATARDWEMIFQMFYRQVPPYGGSPPK